VDPEGSARQKQQVPSDALTSRTDTLALFKRHPSEVRLADEIQEHLDLLTEEHLRRGLSHDEARTEARRAFGGVEPMKEAYRDQRGLPFVDALARDIRFGLRC
jgi:hypothetical protein